MPKPPAVQVRLPAAPDGKKKERGKSRMEPEALRLRRAILKVLPPVLQKLFNLAMSGDVQAAKLLLDRALPPLAPAREPVMLRGESAAEWQRDLVEKVANGELGPREALLALELFERAPAGSQAARIDPDKLRAITTSIYVSGPGRLH